MGAVDEFERSLLRERQAEGIRVTKIKGVYKGRKISLTRDQVEDVQKKVSAGIPKAKYKCSMETLYKYLRQRETV